MDVQLQRGRIVSGWTDGDDPDALPAGDWLSVEDACGTQLYYCDVADLCSSHRRAQEEIYAFLKACAEAVRSGNGGERA